MSARLNPTIATALRMVTALLCSTVALRAEIPALPAPVRVVATSGQVAPGAPGGERFRVFNPFYFSLNEAGQVAFIGDFIGNDGSGANEGVWSEGPGILTLVAKEDHHPPGAAPDVRFTQFFRPVLNDAGHMHFGAGMHYTFTMNLGYGIWGTGSGGLNQVAARGTPAPGTPSGVTFAGASGGLFNNAGQIAFRADIEGDGVDITNSAGIWSHSAINGSLVARQGDQAPGMSTGFTFDVFGNPVLNDAGQVAFYAHLFSPGTGDFGQGVWAQPSGGLVLVAGSGVPPADALPGGGFVGFSDPVINNSGQTAFWAYSGVDDVSGQLEDAIWSEGSGNLAMVAQRGGAAPGTASGVIFGRPDLITFDSPVLNDTGKVAFRGLISGPGVDSTNGEGIWSGATDNLALIARMGDHAPGTPADVYFGSFFPFDGAIAINEPGQIAFTAALLREDDPFQYGRGIWATDTDGVLQLIVRTGMELEVLPGDFRTIIDLSFVNEGAGNGDGRGSGFNNAGQLVFWARFNDSFEGVFVSNQVAVPEPTGLFCAVLGLSSMALRRKKRRVKRTRVDAGPTLRRRPA